MGLFATVLGALDAGHQVALATVIGAGGSTPRHLGARMAVIDDGRTVDTIGGGRIEHEVTQAARAVATGAPPRRLRHHLVHDLAMCCGGWMEVVIGPVASDRDAVAAVVAAIAARRPVVLTTAIADGRLAIEAVGSDDGPAPRATGTHLRERIGGRPRAVVFGAGHVGRALAPILDSLDFEVTVCDDDDTEALATPVAGATRTIDSFDVATVAEALGGFGVDDHVLVVTRDHAVDERVLTALVPHRVGYLGMIGSRGKVARFRKRLAARGIDPAAWADVRAPIGLDLGAETPGEIAIAIAAELVALRHGRREALRGWGEGP